MNGFELTNFLKNNKISFIVNVIAPSLIPDAEPINYIGEYILNNVQIILQNKDYIIYKFQCQHIDILKLIQNVNYSTNKQTLTTAVSPYKIISDINNLIDNAFDSNYLDTTRKINFISSQNSTAIDIIDYCLTCRCR